MKLIQVIEGDITTLQVDAIVNAANGALCGGGGVDGAIHRAAGPQLLAECRTLMGCKPGAAKITQGYDLPAQFVIHAVGPVWEGGDRSEPNLLASCYQASMDLARSEGIRTLAFPAISCGAYRFPIDRAALIAVEQISRAMHSFPSAFEMVFLVANERKVKRALEEAMREFNIPVLPQRGLGKYGI